MSTKKHDPHLPMEGRSVTAEEIVEINARLWFVDRDGYRVVYQGWDTPLYRVAIEDKEHMRFVAVSLCMGAMASQEDVAQHFGFSVRTLQRWIKRHQERGLDGLRRKKGSGAQWKIGATHEAYIRRWFEAGSLFSSGSAMEMKRRPGKRFSC